MKKIIVGFMLSCLFTACNNNNKNGEENIASNKENKTSSTPTHKVTVLKNDKPFMAFETPYSEFTLLNGYLNVLLYDKDDSRHEASSIMIVAQNVKVGTFPINKSGLNMQEGQPRVIISEYKNGTSSYGLPLIKEGTVTITSFDGKTISGSISGTGEDMTEANAKLSLEATFNNVKIIEALKF